MRRILAFSVLACLAASPAFAWGTGSGGGMGTGAAGETGAAGDHGEGDARGFVGQTEGLRWDDELRCPVNTASCR